MISILPLLLLIAMIIYITGVLGSKARKEQRLKDEMLRSELLLSKKLFERKKNLKLANILIDHMHHHVLKDSDLDDAFSELSQLKKILKDQLTANAQKMRSSKNSFDGLSHLVKGDSVGLAEKWLKSEMSNLQLEDRVALLTAENDELTNQIASRKRLRINAILIEIFKRNQGLTTRASKNNRVRIQCDIPSPKQKVSVRLIDPHLQEVQVNKENHRLEFSNAISEESHGSDTFAFAEGNSFVPMQKVTSLVGQKKTDSGRILRFFL